MTTTLSVDKNIGLSLSGGGVRAMAFHAGVLRYLAENGLLESVKHVSSVSGGSLLVGLLLRLNKYKWPTSVLYPSLEKQIKSLLTEKSLQGSALFRLIFFPKNWIFFFSRANILAQSMESLWGIKATLSDLPEDIVWSINGTTAETGKRFRFKAKGFGDYELGYTDCPEFRLSSAMAASAAFPVGIGPLVLKRKDYEWKIGYNHEKDSSGFKNIHIYDGGVYDNLGNEPFFDTSSQQIKTHSGLDFLIVSDAGALFKWSKTLPIFHFGRVKRIADIAFDQARHLRIRSFAGFIKSNPKKGLLILIGKTPEKMCSEWKEVNPNGHDVIKKLQWLTKDEMSRATNYPTTLKKMKIEDYDLISQYGYEMARLSDVLLVK